MSMRFSSLGSGSEGNALLVAVGTKGSCPGTRQTLVLMDCGFGLQDTVSRLARLGVSPEQLSGIVVTHEHGDHISGVARLARKYNLPVWLTHGTLRSMENICPAGARTNVFRSTRQAKDFAGIANIREIDPQLAFVIGDIEIIPYPVPHDAAEPVQFVFSDGARRLGVLTDTGCSTAHIEQMLNGCHALVLECNHDIEMLMNGDYPSSLKQRVGGRFGHLNNQESAGILARLDVSRLQHLIAAHLSRRNNTPELAVRALSAAAMCEQSWVGVATQEEGFAWREIT
jgi:phosphoribosyl 1,2-cyclic phosphodiesterase